MRKIATILILAALLSGSAPLLAADAKETDAKTAKKTIFNRLSDFFSEFDKTYARPGNKQGFWEATADWMRNIDKQ